MTTRETGIEIVKAYEEAKRAQAEAAAKLRVARDNLRGLLGRAESIEIAGTGVQILKAETLVPEHTVPEYTRTTYKIVNRYVLV